MTLKEYSISNEIKRKLGFIIKTARLVKQKDYNGLIETNPYTKENFCKEICHYHTLTKLENETVKEDMLYHIFLEKLGLLFQVEEEDHVNQFKSLDSIVKKILKSGEFLDEDLLNSTILEIESLHFEQDCIIDIHIKLLTYYCEFQKFKQSEEAILFVENYLSLFETIYLGMAYHYLGVAYLKRRNIQKAEEYLNYSKALYHDMFVSKGIVSPNLINIYEYKREYLNAVNLCFELENYFLETHNYKRLIHIYNFLSYFNLMINDFNLAENYFNKCMNIIDDNQSLLRYKDIIQYNFGVYLLKKIGIKESEKYLVDTYKSNKIKEFALSGKVVALKVMTYLKYDEQKIKEIVYDGVDENENEVHSTMLRYFKYKYEKPGYHRKYALEKLIPLYKEKKQFDELLFLYEDLYG